MHFSGHELTQLISHYGYWVVMLFVGVESIGIPFPGETMLLAAAIYAGTTQELDISLVIAAASAGAVIGDNIGYWFGREFGYELLLRFGRYIHFDQRKMKLGMYLFQKHGGKVVFFGRFVAILRTYSAFLAGTTRMHWLKFLAFNAAGGIVWAGLFCFAYYAFGKTLERLQTPADVALIAIAVAGLVLTFRYIRRKEHELAALAEAAYPDERSSAIADAARAAPPDSTGA